MSTAIIEAPPTRTLTVRQAAMAEKKLKAKILLRQGKTCHFIEHSLGISRDTITKVSKELQKELQEEAAATDDVIKGQMFERIQQALTAMTQDKYTDADLGQLTTNLKTMHGIYNGNSDETAVNINVQLAQMFAAPPAGSDTGDAGIEDDE